MPIEIDDLTDKYRVVEMDKPGLLTLAALHQGVRERMVEDLSKQMQEVMAKAKNMNEVSEFLAQSRQTMDGGLKIDKLIIDLVQQFDKMGITGRIRLLMTVHEVSYFTKLAHLPVNDSDAVLRGFTKEQILEANVLLVQVRKTMDAACNPTEDDIKIVVENAARQRLSIFKTPTGKA